MRLLTARARSPSALAAPHEGMNRAAAFAAALELVSSSRVNSRVESRAMLSQEDGRAAAAPGGRPPPNRLRLKRPQLHQASYPSILSVPSFRFVLLRFRFP